MSITVAELIARVEQKLAKMTPEERADYEAWNKVLDWLAMNCETPHRSNLLRAQAEFPAYRDRLADYFVAWSTLDLIGVEPNP